MSDIIPYLRTFYFTYLLDNRPPEVGLVPVLYSTPNATQGIIGYSEPLTFNKLRLNETVQLAASLA